MSTTLTATSTTTTTTASAATSTCQTSLYEIPLHDAACAMPMSNSTYLSVMTSCCGVASIASYSNCDYYCLAQDQSVGDLAECLIKGSEAGMVWCNTNANATATGSIPASGAGTVVATATGTASASDGATGTTGDTEASSTDNAGVSLKRSVGVVVLLVLGGIAQGLL
ncbi:hypothetical protein BDW59DRAFT_162657 [Aspergillus cavernicola]|uniref:Extracellular membrane protein CFEM domain-containing protein n=1 Tax=Aspergillus cavernicola TaxID=176166 RepID=A0ABR4I983_9EURO